MNCDFPAYLIEAARAVGEDGETDAQFYEWLCSDAGPDDWHRFAMEGDWDFHETAVFEWIVSQPDCDKATALLYFWLAQPEYELEFPENFNAFDRSEYRLIELIRNNWRAGKYSRSELAFDREVDLWPTDVADYDKRFGAETEALLPQSMRVSLAGRRLETADLIEGIPKRFWPEDLWPKDMKDAKQ